MSKPRKKHRRMLMLTDNKGFLEIEYSTCARYYIKTHEVEMDRMDWYYGKRIRNDNPVPNYCYSPNRTLRTSVKNKFHRSVRAKDYIIDLCTMGEAYSEVVKNSTSY